MIQVAAQRIVVDAAPVAVIAARPFVVSAAAEILQPVVVPNIYKVLTTGVDTVVVAADASLLTAKVIVHAAALPADAVFLATTLQSNIYVALLDRL